MTHDLERVARRYGTPLYFYDLDAVAAHIAWLVDALPPAVELYYAVKANPQRRVLACFAEHVAGADVASAREISLACDAGFAPRTLSFAGPGKTDAELSLAIERGLGLISVESANELERLATVARGCRRPVPITLRINPARAPQAFALKMGGKPSAFGIDEEQIDLVLARARKLRCIEVVGFHVYAGTQCLDLRAVEENIRYILSTCRRLADVLGHAPEVVNLGGGVGIPYFEGEAAIDARELGAAVARAVGDLRRDDARFATTRYILELGRYFIGPYGSYLTRVLDSKESRGKRFLVVDGGMHHCLAATGQLGTLIKRNYLIENLSRPAAATETVEIVGPLCTPLDTLARGLTLPRAEVGDVLEVHNCGAYGLTASPLLFLGHDVAREVVRYRGALASSRLRCR